MLNRNTLSFIEYVNGKNCSHRVWFVLEILGMRGRGVGFFWHECILTILKVVVVFDTGQCLMADIFLLICQRFLRVNSFANKTKCKQK